MPNEIAITEEFAQQMVDYLQTRPYNEVYILISELQDSATRARLVRDAVAQSQSQTNQPEGNTDDGNQSDEQN